MKFDSLIFDLDGTLWDCSEASANAFNKTFQKFGLTKEASVEFVQSISGLPSSECDQLLLKDVPEQYHSDFLDTLLCEELKAIKEAGSNCLYPEVPRGIQQLSRDFKLFVVSNCFEEYMNIFLEFTPIGSKFLDVESHGKTGKPKGENLCLLIERNGLHSPCYIGDTRGDETAAQFAGLPFFYAEYGFGEVKAPQESFTTFSNLVQYFTSSPE